MLMKCPSCKQGDLKNDYLEHTLFCRTCEHCRGNWLLLGDYLRWKNDEVNINFSDSRDEAMTIEQDNSAQVLLCPATGAFMIKYRIVSSIPHRLYLSPTISGMWLDNGEWDLLKQEGLEYKLNMIFSDAWQKKIRLATTRSTLEQLYQNQFGLEQYSKLQEVRKWLIKQPLKSQMLAYLLAEDPYRA